MGPLSRVRAFATAAVATIVIAAAGPAAFADDVFKNARWVEIKQGTSFTWHERSIRWLGSSPPAIVQASPNEDHRIREWKIRGRAAGEPFLIEGFLGYRPSLEAASDDGMPAWAIALVAAGDGALQTWSVRGDSRNRKSCTSVPSRVTAWARMPASYGSRSEDSRLGQYLRHSFR